LATLAADWSRRESTEVCARLVRLPPPKVVETNESSAEISLKWCASYAAALTMGGYELAYTNGRTPVTTFLFLAISSAFLVGMVAGALTRRIVD
jgi:hypothetical protein